ncbi:MAG TPA: hypothetical protein VFB33_12045 [Candidatus Binataceae bacterium]|nr:hypothetical protein [Candidatus Binataceae bacterium]
MLTSVPMLLLGLAAIASVGSLFGYLLEPGRDGRPATLGQLMADSCLKLSGHRCDTNEDKDWPRWAA